MRRARIVTAAIAMLLALSACGDAEPSATASSPPASPSETDGPAPTAPSATPSAGSIPPAAPAAWQRLDDAPFARLEMATAAHDGRIWLAGGLSPLGEALTDVDVYDPATGEWTDGPSLPTGVHHAALVSDGDRLLLVGGYLGSDFNRPTDLVLILATDDDAWESGPPLPALRAAGAAAFDGVRVVYAGGVGPGGVTADVYALAGDAWERVGGMRLAREHLAATTDGQGRVWLMGGRVGGLAGNLGIVETVEGDTISEVGEIPTPRGGVAAFYDEHVGACLTGGEAPDRAYTVVECVTADGTVTPLAELNEPHHGHGAAVIDGVAYVMLGGPEPALAAAPVIEALELTP
jgi:non-specific serine/threonine protein kinase